MRFVITVFGTVIDAVYMDADEPVEVTILCCSLERDSWVQDEIAGLRKVY